MSVKIYTNPKKGRQLPLDVSIAYEDFQRMITWCQMSSPKEVGGMALVEDIDGELVIQRPELLPQEVTGGSVELDAEKVLRWLEAKFGKEAIQCKMPNLSFCLWHSHPTFAVGFSPTDTKWIEEYVTRGWLVSVCVNNREDFDIRVDTLVGGDCEDSAIHIGMEASLYYQRDVPAALEKECKTEFAKHVKAKSYPNLQKGYSKKGGQKPRQLPTGGQFPTTDGLAAIIDQREACTMVGGLGGSRLAGSAVITDPCLWRLHIDTLTGEESVAEMKIWREHEYRSLGAIINGFRSKPRSKVEVTFNSTGSMTVVIGKTTEKIAVTEAGRGMLCERLGVEQTMFNKWFKSGVKVTAYPGKSKDPTNPILSITQPPSLSAQLVN